MSDFLARKVKTFFKQMDLNHDGYVSMKDFVDMAERHCDTEIYHTRAVNILVWRLWMKSAESDDNGLLTPSIFAESVKQQRKDPEFKEACLLMCKQYFKILDVNGDGFLQEEEFARAIANTGIQDAGVSRRAFDAIDANKDDKISLEEFSTALVEYLISDDENSPYREIWGPLVD